MSTSNTPRRSLPANSDTEREIARLERMNPAAIAAMLPSAPAVPSGDTANEEAY